MIDINQGWERADAQVFWGEIAPCNHVVQIYENEEAFNNLLSSYVIGGIRAGDSIICIATEDHIKGVNEKIRAEGFNVFDLILKEQFIPLDAEETLNKFMIDGWPDENLFRHVVTNVMHRAKKHNRHNVRAFGEMVALLWAKGEQAATMQLEQLWNDFCATENFCLFCAYPKSVFTNGNNDPVMHICQAHSQIVAGYNNFSNDLFYKNLA